MIISEEQARLAAQYLQTHKSHEAMVHAPESDEAFRAIIGRVTSALALTPDVRDDRVAEARELLTGTMPSNEVVATKLIGRVISDSLR